MSYCDDSLYKIGADPSNLISLKDLGVAAPDQVTFQKGSIYYVRADISRVGDGYSIATWIWDVISIDRLAKLLQFLNDEDYVELYIRTDKRDGTFARPANAFRVFSAMMWKPILAGDEGNSIVRSPRSMQSVQLKFVNLIEMSTEYYL
jgi:hypothetical protein